MTRADRGKAPGSGYPRPGGDAALRARDVRRKRPPMLSFLLRLETARRIARVISLLVLDLIGVAAALATALAIKTALQDGFVLRDVLHQTKQWLAFAYLVTVLMFAHADLYADRPRRLGLGRIAKALFQAAIWRWCSRWPAARSSELLRFLRHLRFRDHLHHRLAGAAPAGNRMAPRQAGYERRALLVGSGKHLEDVAEALEDRARTRVALIGYVSLTPRPHNGLRSLGLVSDLPEIIARERVQEVILADPEFPQERAVELVDTCHQRGVTVNIAPTTMEILINRAEFVRGRRCPCSRCARRCSKASTSCSSGCSTWWSRRWCCSCSRRCCC